MSPHIAREKVVVDELTIKDLSYATGNLTKGGKVREREEIEN
jgi:hypothetical protein